jgi:formylglycine-generating enzyme required for sulfatase activity
MMDDAVSATVSNNLNANRKYYTMGYANGTMNFPDSLRAANALNLYYQGNKLLWFIAYYPFTENIVNHTIPIDVSKQDNPAAIDLLYTKTPERYNDQQTTPIVLTFRHVLAKLVVNVEVEDADNGKDKDVNLHGMQASITSMPVTGTFHLDSTLTYNPALANLGLFGSGGKSAVVRPVDFDDTTFQAIIIPHTINPAARPVLQFRTQHRLYNWPLPANEPAAFEQGMVYTYNLKLQGETVAGFTGSITPWDTIINVPQSGWQAQTGDAYKRLIRDGMDTLAVRYIRATQFQMGTPNSMTAAGNWKSTPDHPVELTHSYHITETEITNAQFCKFLNDPKNGILYPAGHAQAGQQVDSMASNANYDVSALIGIAALTNTRIFQISNAADGNNYTIKWNTATRKWEPVPGMEKHPMAGVNWYGALAYAKWAGGSLPTEAQWEFAARGGVDMAFDFIDGTTGGTNIANYAFADQTTGGPQEVAKLQKNGYGLYDVFGNVAEWCWDRVSDGATAEYYDPATQSQNPEGSNQASGTYAITRGSNYQTASTTLFIGDRNAYSMNNVSAGTGFRVAFTFN